MKKLKLTSAVLLASLALSGAAFAVDGELLNSDLPKLTFINRSVVASQSVVVAYQGTGGKACPAFDRKGSENIKELYVRQFGGAMQKGGGCRYYLTFGTKALERLKAGSVNIGTLDGSRVVASLDDKGDVNLTLGSGNN